uniref:Uncharacterized protein n=1 Tax=Steinernema glaseri TaxID=37863 RepID=A0A1I7YIA7_9BILA
MERSHGARTAHRRDRGYVTPPLDKDQHVKALPEARGPAWIHPDGRTAPIRRSPIAAGSRSWRTQIEIVSRDESNNGQVEKKLPCLSGCEFDYRYEPCEQPTVYRKTKYHKQDTRWTANKETDLGNVSRIFSQFQERSNPGLVPYYNLFILNLSVNLRSIRSLALPIGRGFFDY